MIDGSVVEFSPKVPDEQTEKKSMFSQVSSLVGFSKTTP
jgi:hypothetical protein